MTCHDTNQPLLLVSQEHQTAVQLAPCPAKFLQGGRELSIPQLWCIIEAIDRLDHLEKLTWLQAGDAASWLAEVDLALLAHQLV